MATKKFDPQLYAENDAPAKEAVKAFIERSWKKKVIEGEKYGIDLEIVDETGLLSGGVEVERRMNWTDKFPFSTVHVPSRKAKLLSNYIPTCLFSVRADMRQALWCRGDTILQSPLVESSNKYVTSGEKFYAVPIEKWRLVNL